VLNQAMGVSLRLLTKVAGSPLIEKYGLTDTLNRVLKQGTEAGFQAASQMTTAFKKIVPRDKPARLEPSPDGKPKVFDLRPTEEQEMIQDTMRRFASEVIAEAAEAADGSCTAPDEVLNGIQELGLLTLAVPSELGGDAESRSPLNNVIALEALATGDIGLALAAASPLGVACALVDFGTAEQQGKYLPAFTGETLLPAAIALVEPHPAFDPFSLRTRAHRKGGKFVLEGRKSLVPLASRADLFIVAADVPGSGPRLFLVERGTPGLEIRNSPSMGARGAELGEVRLSGVEVSESAVLGGSEGADYELFVNRGRLAWAALAVGQAQAVVDYVVPYCNERTAFGEPISSRQAVAFLIANMGIEVESMRVLMQRAAARTEHGENIVREAHLARLLASQKAMEIGSNGVQLLGGHGFVKDHPVERWYRNLRVVGVADAGLYL
jgi:alkylation response protein AidB-like acyl-CoA dehydrogenase